MSRALLPSLLMLLVLGCEKEPTQAPPNAGAEPAAGDQEDAKAKDEATPAEAKGEGDGAVDGVKADGADEESCEGCMWYEAATPEAEEHVSHHTPLPAEAGCYRRVQHPHAQMHMETQACAAECCPGH